MNTLLQYIYMTWTTNGSERNQGLQWEIVLYSKVRITPSIVIHKVKTMFAPKGTQGSCWIIVPGISIYYLLSESEPEGGEWICACWTGGSLHPTRSLTSVRLPGEGSTVHDVSITCENSAVFPAQTVEDLDDQLPLTASHYFNSRACRKNEPLLQQG